MYYIQLSTDIKMYNQKIKTSFFSDLLLLDVIIYIKYYFNFFPQNTYIEKKYIFIVI